MQTGVRDIRLATTPADLQKAGDYIAARLKSVDEYADGMLKLSHSPENRERIAKVRDMADQYANGSQQIAAIRSELIGIEAKRGAGGELSAEALAKIAKLNDDANRIAAEVTLPIAAKLKYSPNKVVDYAKHRVEEDIAAALQEMSSAERNSLIVGVAAALLLIGTCVFSVDAVGAQAR